MRWMAISRLFAKTLSLALMLMLSAGASAQHGSVVADNAGQSAPQTAATPTPETKFDVPDAARRAILFTKYGLEVKLETQNATMHARAIVTVKNESAAALSAIPLQISSSLAWEAINAEGKALRFAITPSRLMLTIPVRWMRRW